jgi:hypothetical protein
MDEFNDLAKVSVDELDIKFRTAPERISEQEANASKRVASMLSQPEPANIERVERLQRAEAVAEAGRMKAASDVLARAERIIKSEDLKKTAVASKKESGVVFQNLFDELVEDPVTLPVAELPSKPAKRDSVIALYDKGKTIAQIARELGITQNEVQLIIGLNAKKQ